jgi:hypothetical protein
MLASGTRVRGFKPGRRLRIFRAKNSSTCLPSEGEVKPSVPCRSFVACKKSLTISVEVVIIRLNLIGHLSPIIQPFTNRGLSRRLTYSASGDNGGTKGGAQRACCFRPRYIGAVWLRISVTNLHLPDDYSTKIRN